jgi:hypothetical protein
MKPLLRIFQIPGVIVMLVLNVCFFLRGAAGWWVASRVSDNCSSVAEAQTYDWADCHFTFSTGIMIGGFLYLLPDACNRRTVVPLTHLFPKMCSCTAFRLEMVGILLFSSLQAILVGYCLHLLIRRRT